MTILLDTHVLLWLAQDTKRLSAEARDVLTNPENHIFFSVISLWEVGVKRNLNRPDFQIDAIALRAELLRNGFEELPLLGEHVLAVNSLPALHRDPFDRLLICQAVTERCSLMTDDDKILQYPNLLTFRV